MTTLQNACQALIDSWDSGHFFTDSQAPRIAAIRAALSESQLEAASGGSKFVERELLLARELASCRGDDARLNEADAELADLRRSCKEGWRYAAELEAERKRLQAELDSYDKAALPAGYEPHELPADYTGKLWIESQVRALARTSPVHRPYTGWTDADADAARLALELECILIDRDIPMPAASRWWDSAHEALELHRNRMAVPPKESSSPPKRKPLTTDEIWRMQEMRGWPACDHYRLERIVRAVERAHGIGGQDDRD